MKQLFQTKIQSLVSSRTQLMGPKKKDILFQGEKKNYNLSKIYVALYLVILPKHIKDSYTHAQFLDNHTVCVFTHVPNC